MQKVTKLLALCLTLALSLSFISCSGSSSENEPAIAFCQEFIKKAATGDKSLKDMIDFEAAANKYGLPEKDLIKNEGQEKWNKIKDDMVTTIITSFGELKGNYKSAFTDFKVDEKGADYWIVSYKNPVKERKMMKVRKVNGKLKGYFYSK